LVESIYTNQEKEEVAMVKTILATTAKEEVQKQMTLFSIAGILLSCMSIFAWWLAAAGLAFNARGLLLTWHKDVKERQTYRMLSAIGIILGLISFSAYLLRG
jgi:cobalamin synthase